MSNSETFEEKSRNAMKLSICFNYLVFWGQDVSKSKDYSEPFRSLLDR